MTPKFVKFIVRDKAPYGIILFQILKKTMMVKRRVCTYDGCGIEVEKEICVLSPFLSALMIGFPFIVLDMLCTESHTLQCVQSWKTWWIYESKAHRQM